MTATIVIEDITEDTAKIVAGILSGLNISHRLVSDAMKTKSWGYISDLGLQKGDILRFINDSEETVVIVDDKKVLYCGGDPISLSQATKNAISNMNNMTQVHKGYSGRTFWTFDGETLERRGRRLGLV